MKTRCAGAMPFFALFILILLTPSASASAAGQAKLPLDVAWGGHLRTITTAAILDHDSAQRTVERDPYYDGQVELRLKNQLQMGTRWAVSTHYELVALGGDSLESSRSLAEDASGFTGALLSSQGIDDERRLFDLTGIIDDEERHLVYHRLDRLNLSYTPQWGTLRLGRQALTWGDGRVFNPLDLFNPFAPTAVQRDYKSGDDMAHLQLPLGSADLELLYLPRRDPESGDLAEDQSSYALKVHFPVEGLEMDLMAARHFSDGVLGLGSSGYLGEALWRMNATYTFLSAEDDAGADAFFQAVANLDYAWMWAGRNVYGIVEFYYNELGYEGGYGEAAGDSALAERLARGEIFTLGRYYLAGQLQVEVHPLIQVHTMGLVNLSDPSGLVQPQLLWDFMENWQAILGGQWHWGERGSEFGGYDLGPARTGPHLAPADQIYLWVSFYF